MREAMTEKLGASARHAALGIACAALLAGAAWADPEASPAPEASASPAASPAEAAASPAAPSSESPTASPGASSVITPVRIPMPADAIDARCDESGTLHVLALRSGKGYYLARPHGGKWTSQVQIGALPPDQEWEGRVRLALGKKDIYALWRSTRVLALFKSSDAGKSWTKLSTDSLLADKTIEVAGVLVGDDQAVHVVWTDDRDPADPKDRVARHLYLATSTDGGKTFGKPRAITADGPRICPCCDPAMLAGPSGLLLIAYRSSVKNLKETTLLVSNDSGKTFTTRTLSTNKWFLQACPSSGPSMAAGAGTLVVAWNSDKDVFSATSTDGGKSFSEQKKIGVGAYHQVAAPATGGMPLVLWEDGEKLFAAPATGAPMSPVAIPPHGVLVACPDGKYELVDHDRAEPE